MIRAIAFNVLFYGLNVALCLACLPVIVMPRRAAFDFIHFYVSCIYWLERHVLGLDYEVRGREHLPASGPYIVAAKHQSAYETFKLHLLWRDPAVVLKRELIRVPLWGRFLARSEPIAIDRGNARASIRQLNEGARRVRDQGRVLVIFPQGTRVNIAATVAERPYRIGVEQAHGASGMQVIPMALNSGLYWPRNGWLKKPGTVVFEFLPPIASHLTGKAMLNDLETRLEQASNRLVGETTPSARKRSRWTLAVVTIAVAAVLYVAAWFYAASLIRGQIDLLYRNARQAGVTITGAAPAISGFPGPHRVRFGGTVANGDMALTLPQLTIKGIFLPGHRVTVSLPQGATYSGPGSALFDSVDLLTLRFIVPATVPERLDENEIRTWQKSGAQISVESLELLKHDLLVKGSGTLGLDEHLQPEGEGNFRLTGFADFIVWLQSRKLLSDKSARIAQLVAQGLSQADQDDREPHMRAALTLKDRQVYVGPLLALTLPAIAWPQGSSLKFPTRLPQ